MAPRAHSLRAAVFLAVAALGLHQLRYLLAFGDGSSAALAREGHAYLGALVVPVLAVALAVVLGHLLTRVAGAPAPAVRVRRVWPVASAALLAIYAGQELLEGTFAAGHPAGLAGLVGANGWVAVPLALALGALVALTVKVAAVAEAPARVTAPSLRPAPRPVLLWIPRPAGRIGAAARVLARHLAGRGPPAVCR